MLEAMQERQEAVEGARGPLPAALIGVAAQNSGEFEGTFALPQAQLDRFLVRAAIGYPTETAERTIARRYQRAAEPLDAVEPVLDAATLIDMRDDVRRIRVADEVEAYLVAVVRATRTHPDVQLGASPRATVALYRAAQAAALLDRRAVVLPDDVKAVAVAVLAHRLILDFDRGLRGASPDAVMAEILGTVAVPPIVDP